MSTKSEIIADLTEAFNSDDDLGESVVELVFNIYSKETYDTLTGETTKTLLETTDSRGIFTGSWKYEVFNNPIEPLDETLLVLQNELDLVPVIGMEVVSYRGTTRVTEIRQDPMNITWEFKVRF